MASKKQQSYKNSSVDELKSALQKLEKEYQEYRFEKVVGDASKTHEIKRARKDIARIKTFLRLHELGQQK